MLKDQKIVLLGIISEDRYELVLKGFQRNFDSERTLVFFSPYSEYEIPVGARFSRFVNNKSNKTIRISSKLIDITQQWGLPFNSIPMGHKTIIRVEFDKEYIDYIKTQIPTIKSWEDSDKGFYLTN